MSKLIKEMLDALNAVNQNKTEPYDRKGEVKRIEGKIAWVKLEGSDRETPIQMTIACDVGDTVQARIGGGSAWLTGNLTAPPTDDKKANEAISMVTNVVQEIQETVDEALEDVSSVEDVTVQYCLSDSSSTFTQYGDWSNTPPQYVSGKYYWTRTVLYDEDGNPTYGTPQYSQDTQLSVETDVAFKSNNNHFWYDSSGAYVTTQNKSYASGSAVRITASGILQQVNGSTVSSWTNSGISFLQGGDTVASFGSGGVNLYGNGYLGLNVSASGISLYSYGTERAVLNSTFLRVGASNEDQSRIYSSGTFGVFSSSGTEYGSMSRYMDGIELYSPDSIRVHSPSTTIQGTSSFTLYSGGTLQIYTAQGETLTIHNGISSVSFGTTNALFRPTYDDVVKLGSTSYRWTAVAATNGTIETSDRKYKDVLGGIDFAEDFIMSLEPVQYQWKKSDHRRIHMGFIAQDVAKASAKIGKDLSVYEASYKTDSEEEIKYFGEEVDDEKLLWSMSYSELIAPLVKVVQEQNKRITELEGRIA